MSIGDRIKTRRKAVGLSVDELAAKLGKNRATVYRYESNDIEKLPTTVLEPLAKALNTTPAYLMGWTQYGTQLRKARLHFGVEIEELSAKTGISTDALKKYEQNDSEPSNEELALIAAAYGVDLGSLLWSSFEEPSLELSQFDNIKPIHLKRFPMLGSIACGEPIFADEDRESFVMADMDIGADFCLTAKGDSMINARIYDGDVVFIKQTDVVENGEIAAVIIEDEATLKRVYYDRENNILQLVAENPKYKPLVYRDEQLDTVHILGKAVYFMSAL